MEDPKNGRGCRSMTPKWKVWKRDHWGRSQKCEKNIWPLLESVKKMLEGYNIVYSPLYTHGLKMFLWAQREKQFNLPPKNKWMTTLKNHWLSKGWSNWNQIYVALDIIFGLKLVLPLPPKMSSLMQQGELKIF